MNRVLLISGVLLGGALLAIALLSWQSGGLLTASVTGSTSDIEPRDTSPATQPSSPSYNVTECQAVFNQYATCLSTCFDSSGDQLTRENCETTCLTQAQANLPETDCLAFQDCLTDPEICLNR